MSGAVIGMPAGMAPAFAGWFGGFGAFLPVAALGAVGAGPGHLADHGTDWRGFPAPATGGPGDGHRGRGAGRPHGTG
ncbi:hypothetical protein, partial [Streptomyces sp. MH60]|uniref:hypothetical protein n=1 Tax=Streptomyces sp. MH60 TaxID=1940758 RepID=UPI000CEF14A2